MGAPLASPTANTQQTIPNFNVVSCLSSVVSRFAKLQIAPEVSQSGLKYWVKIFVAQYVKLMNKNFMSSLKKLFVGFAVVALVLGAFGAFITPASAAMPAAGSLIKMAGNSAVYYYDGTKRFVFPNEKTYKTWYSDFSGVVTVSATDMYTISIGGNVTYRPGTYLVKITTDPKVYSVEPGGKLRWVTTEAIAISLWGANWNTKIHDVSDAFFVNYVTGSSMTSAMYPAGSLVSNGGNNYYVDANNVLRKFSSAASMSANRFWNSFVQTLASTTGYTMGSDITGAETAFTNVAGSSVVVSTGTSLSVSAAADTPVSATHASGTAYNNALKFNVTAGSDGEIKITGVTITRGGISIDSNISGVAVFNAAGKRHGNFVTFADTKATSSFTSDPIIVLAGTTQAIWIKTNISGTSGTYQLSLAGSSAIATTATVSGSFPISGNIFTLANGAAIVGTLTADAVLVHNNGANDVTAVSVNLGTINQEIGKFRFVAGANEDIKIAKITMYNNGNTNDADISNIKLVGPDGTTLATVANATTRNVVFDLSASPYTIIKGNTKDLSMRIDITGGSTRNVRFVIQNDYDIEVTGKDTGSGILATAATTVDGAFPIGDTSGGGANCAAAINCINKLTIGAGTALFNKASDSTTGNIAVGATSVVLGKWEFTPQGEDMEIRQVAYTLTRTVALTGTFRVQVDGSTVYSVAPASMGATGVKTTVTLNSYPILKAGVKAVFTMLGDISTTATSGVTYLAALDVMQVKRISTNDLVDPSVTDTSANTLTVSTASMSVSKNTSFSDTTVVAGLANAKVGSYNFTASSTEDVAVSSITVALTNITNISNLMLKFGTTQLGSTTTSPGASNVVSISDFTVTKGTSATVDVYVTTNSATTGTEISSLTATSATGKSSGTTVSATGLTSTGQTITFSTGGTVTIALDTTNTPVSQIMHSGMVDQTLLATRLTTNNAEAVKVTNIQVTVANGAADFKDLKLFVNGLPVGATVQLVKGVALFSNAAGLFTIAQDSTITLYVKGSTTTSGTMDSTAVANVSIDYIEAIGLSGGTTIKPGTTLQTTWTATTAAITTANLTVGDTTGFHRGDVVYVASNVGGGSGSLGIVLSEPTTTTSLTVSVMTAVTTNAAGTITKIASGAWTPSDNSDNPDIPTVDTTVTSSKGFNVGDPVIYSTGTDTALGYVSAISSATQMSIASLENIAGNVDIVAKIGTDTVTTTSNGTAATADTVIAGEAETVASTSGFNVGDLVFAVDTINVGSFGIVTAVGSTTSMTVSTDTLVDATGGTTVTYVRVGAVNPATTLVSTAASAGAAVVEGVAHTVTSTTGFGVGDVVVSQQTAFGALLGRVTAVTSAVLMTVASSTADAGIDTRVTRLPGAVSSGKFITMQDVEPVITATSGFVGGAATPGTGQEVGKFDVKADGDRNLSLTKFNVKMGGSNFPWKYVNSFDLYAGATLLSSATNTIGTIEADAGGTFVITGSTTTINLCHVSTGANANGELAIVGEGTATGAIMDKIRAGDIIGFFVSSTAYVTYTVTSATVGAACTGTANAGDVALVVSGGNLVGTVSDDVTPILYVFSLSFDTNSATPLPAQTITAGSTTTYTVKADTTNVKTGVTSGTVNFNVQVAGTQGSTGDVTWAYTPSGGSAITATTVSDSYPVNGPTFTY